MLLQAPVEWVGSCIIMASGPVDLIEPFESEETGEEFSRKKKSKFQTFKNFFAKKKKTKEPPSPVGESKLKPSQSSTDVRAPTLDSSIHHLSAEPGSKGSMGNKALSHDSVFVFDSSSPDIVGKMSSQENLPGKVKALQLQVQQNLRLGSPPLVISNKKTEDAGAISEDDGLPRSPPEISTLHDVLTCSTNKSSNLVQRHSSLSLGGTDSEDDQVPSESSSRPRSPLSFMPLGSPVLSFCHLLPIDFNSPPTPLGCLDTSAARHRIAMNPRKQKGFTHTKQFFGVEKEQCILGHAEGKTSHIKLLEKADSQEENSEGLSIQNASNLNGSHTNDALPMSRASDILRYSWNAGSAVDENCILESENQNCMETDLQASVILSCTNVQSSLAKCEEEEEMEQEGVNRTWYPSDDPRLNPKSSAKKISESFETLQPETEAVGRCDMLLSDLHGNGVDKDHDVAAESNHVTCLQPVDQKAKDSRVGSDAIQIGGVEDKPDGRDSSVTPEGDPVLCIPQSSSSAMETPSETETAVAFALKNNQMVKEDAGGWAADREIPLCQGHDKPTASPQGGSAVLNTHVDRLLLQSAAGEKLFLPTELRCSVLSSSPGGPEAVAFRKLGNPSPGGLATTEIVPKSSSTDDKAGDQPESAKTKEESKSPDEIAKTQPKSVSAKPVRFTIAPAWQRSLSGGSGSVDGSCPRSTPSSPIRPELFEGMPQLEAATQGCILSSPERLEKCNRAIGTVLSSAFEWPNEEMSDRENPFGVKLRRTSSLLNYQTEQQHPEPPKQVPLPAPGTCSASVKQESTPPGSGKPLQNLTGSPKALVPKPSVQEENHPVKASKPEEVAPKQQMGRPSEQVMVAHWESPSSEPAWISMAKLKQKSFRGHPLAKGQKEQEKNLADGEQGVAKHVEISQQEKQMKCPGENFLKKSSASQACVLESKLQLKMAPSATKATPLRTATQETMQLDKEMRSSPSLPKSLCSSAEPPWLSLAKKKAKAWSEMPQIVQ
ncbi:acrosomal protein KIAA1210 homolog isoform X2 [Rhineura floridana]|uniref:acrosomal protein KIAA1210 homolog isoform X2 n=1 Tax=Rhineura floridana TaxID=261503 RepID=UPI002AC83272|nr:acrosomal protein KIAA1210 homolog isoform X2 [Rhineura floridana]